MFSFTNSSLHGGTCFAPWVYTYSSLSDKVGAPLQSCTVSSPHHFCTMFNANSSHFDKFGTHPLIPASLQLSHLAPCVQQTH